MHHTTNKQARHTKQTGKNRHNHLFKIQIVRDVTRAAEVGSIEVVQSDEPILGATGVGLYLGVDPDRIDGAEVALDTTELLVVDHVEEARFELP